MLPHPRPFLALLLLGSGAALAQEPAPPGTSLAAMAARRFPQPVRVGSLIGRTVLRPLESQPVLGRLESLVRGADGGLAAVVRYGGLFGLGGRPVAVPLDAVVLLGDEVEVADLTPEQLDALPTFEGAEATAVGPDEVVRVGLARPSH